ncbi:MAG: hypothetical protein ACI93N_001594, partial [Flavobacteriaceae bacterium]
NTSEKYYTFNKDDIFAELTNFFDELHKTYKYFRFFCRNLTFLNHRTMSKLININENNICRNKNTLIK